MEVFKFNYDGSYFCMINAENQDQSEEHFKEVVSDEFDSVENVPEAKWDEKNIKVYEDNDTETEPFYTSIREEITFYPCVICTNDADRF